MATTLTPSTPPSSKLGTTRRAPRERRPFRLDTGSSIGLALVALGGVVALFAAYLFVGSGMAASRTQDTLYGQMEKDLALAMVPVGGQIATGTPVGILDIPKLGVEQVFVVGASSEQTLTAPGLRHDSVLPGQAGISVLVGRRATGGKPFAHLDQLAPGDVINVTTGQGQWTYVVDLVRTSDAAPSQIPLVASRLTLVTAGNAVLSDRTLSVSAALDGTAIPANTAAPTQAVDNPGTGSQSRGVALLLWSQLLLVVVVAATWAAVRLPGRTAWSVWIGAVPVLLAVLWHVFENLTAFLPNTL